MKNWSEKLGSPDAVVGYLFLLNAFLYFGIWYVYLFVAQQPCASAVDAALEQLTYSFSEENSSRRFFVWMALAPVFCCLLAAAYFLRGARSRNGALVLLVAGVILGLATVVLSNVVSAILIAVPIIFGWRRFVQARREQDNVA